MQIMKNQKKNKMNVKDVKDFLKKNNVFFHIISIVFFALITLVYCSPVLEGKRIKQGDIIQFQGMSKEIQDFRQKTGNEALWTNSMFGGMPAYQISVNYPNNILFHIDQVLQLGFPRPIGVMFLYFLGFYIFICEVNKIFTIIQLCQKSINYNFNREIE